MKQIQRVQDTLNELVFQVVMPLDVSIHIPEDATVRLLKEITERMDFSKLNQSYTRFPGRREATPKQLFEIIILGYMKGRYSLRDIEESCRYDICFRYLLADKRVPDHSRLGRFVRERLSGDVGEHLFYQLVHYLRERGEVTGKYLFVDGTKIEANANRYSFVWLKAVGKNAEKLEAKTLSLLNELTQTYPMELCGIETADGFLAGLERLAEETGLVYVHGKGKRKTQLQKHIETLRSYVDKAAEYRKHRAIAGKRNSYSKTDHDATFMRMKDDHMRNGQLKPGYNVQLGVESEYIVGLDISSERNDTATLLPLLERMEHQGGLVHDAVITDAGYESEENHTRIEERGQLAYIKPQNYEKSKTRRFRKNAFLRENMPYDAEDDSYLCPGGKTLRHQYDTIRRSKTGFEQKISVYESEGCSECTLKPQCTRAKGNRKIEVSKTFLLQRASALERITSEIGVVLRVNRSIQVEGTFGVLKEDWDFRRFLRRGSQNVMIELILYAFAFNVKKLHNKRSQNRLQSHLFVPEKMTSLPDTG